MSHTFGYSREFDGLRGIAIVLVMASHLGILAIAGGFFGVDIFFVLSGFLITTLLVAEFDNSGARVSFKHFYIRRALRLGPALALLLVTYLALGAWVGKDPAAYGWRALIALCYVSNWVQAFGLYDLRALSHTWSLSIEEQFYIVWPVILVALLRSVKDRRRIMLILAAVVLGEMVARSVATLRGLPWVRIQFGVDLHADPLLCGCLLGLMLACPSVRGALSRKAGAIAVAAMLGALFLASQVFIPDDPEAHIRRYHLWGLSGTELATAAILMHAVLPGTSMLKRFLAWRPLVGVGQISYGLYLWHYPIFVTLGGRLQGHVDRAQPLQFGTAIGAAIILTLLVAMISYRFVERPVLRLKARFAGRPLPAQSL